MKRQRAVVVVGAALVVAVALGRAWAKKSTTTFTVDYEPGESWSIEDTLRARIPDPQTGLPLTPTTRGIFRYRVEKVLGDGGIVVEARVVSMKAGSSLSKMNPVPLEYQGQAERLLVIAKDGSVYGLFGDAARKRVVLESKGVAAWLAAVPQKPWFWYKIPSAPIKVGAKTSRSVGDETWTITRQADEVVDGAACAVFEARLDQEALKVVETTWLSRDQGRPIRREIVEKRAKDVSSTLTQVRL